ncbi:hypothetical protein CTI14_67475, partial [Methylobacterium radiotolerans]
DYDDTVPAPANGDEDPEDRLAAALAKMPSPLRSRPSFRRPRSKGTLHSLDYDDTVPAPANGDEDPEDRLAAALAKMPSPLR